MRVIDKGTKNHFWPFIDLICLLKVSKPNSCNPILLYPLNCGAGELAAPKARIDLFGLDRRPSTDCVEGKPGEQLTMFILDYSGNPIEFKAFKNQEEMFAA